MNSFVTSGGVLYCSYEGERTILRGKAALFAGGEFFNVACYVTYGRMACGTLSISEDGKAEKENLFWERYMSCTGGQMCYFYRVRMNLSHKNSRIKENFFMIGDMFYE